MRIRTPVVAPKTIVGAVLAIAGAGILFAAGSAIAAPQAKAPHNPASIGAQPFQEPPPPKAKPQRDPDRIDAQGFQKVLEQNRGKALLVNFWATWCEPCRDEYPMLNELAKQYGPRGLHVVGVSMDDEGDVILMRRFLARYKPVFPNYWKAAGNEAAFRQSILPEWTGSLPITLFYGRDGKLVGNFVGEKSREQYEQVIQKLLGGDGAAAPGK